MLPPSFDHSSSSLMLCSSSFGSTCSHGTALSTVLTLVRTSRSQTSFMYEYTQDDNDELFCSAGLIRKADRPLLVERRHAPDASGVESKHGIIACKTRGIGEHRCATHTRNEEGPIRNSGISGLKLFPDRMFGDVGEIESRSSADAWRAPLIPVSQTWRA